MWWRIGAAVRLGGVFVAIAAGVAALALMPAASLARRMKAHLPRVYVGDTCVPELAPRAFVVYGCSTSPAPPPLTGAYDLTYRHYGTGLALATGKLAVCLGPKSQVLEACLEGERYQAEAGQSYLSFPATFRFFDVVSCTTHEYPGRPVPRLYYGKLSYTFAGRPWETHTDLPPDRLAESRPAKCHPVRLSRR
jgi:hypothetical protein